MDRILDAIAKAPMAMKAGVVAALVVLITVVNYFAFSVPTLGSSITEIEQRITRAEGEQRKLDNDLIEKTAIANNLNQFRREKELLEQRLQEALAELPEQKKIDELLQLFQERARKAGLEIASIEPLPDVNEGFYARVPINMQVTGNFHEVVTFFDSLARLRRIVNVNNIQLDTPKDTGGKVILSGRFLVTTFMFVQPKAAPAKAGAPGAKP
jgi:type IV pilus assembly protein PilO